MRCAAKKWPLECGNAQRVKRRGGGGFLQPGAPKKQKSERTASGSLLGAAERRGCSNCSSMAVCGCVFRAFVRFARLRTVASPRHRIHWCHIIQAILLLHVFGTVPMPKQSVLLCTENARATTSADTLDKVTVDCNALL